ncbi:MAG: hypothetical protein MUF54_07445 [Polyangiaceae bacterium]|nr:hypothetical protein [Polyangiaceae bacterium]
MDHRARLAAIAAATFLAFGATSHVAQAAPKDKAAQKIDQDAMNNDFLMADFPKAEENLRKAISTCGASGCAPKVKAQILVHLGIVQVNQGKTDDAKQSFVGALRLDGGVAPDKDFTTADISRVFDEAKAQATKSVRAVDEPASPQDQPPPGEVFHQRVPEQVVNTPVPIWVVAPDGLPVGKVLVRYKPFGGSWKKLSLKKKSGGWGGLIPCVDVGVTGDLKYYINVLDKAGDPVTSLGSINEPYVTKIKNQLDGAEPALHGESPPARCAEQVVCPPGFPGCSTSGARGSKDLGASCDETSECQAGLICKQGVCEQVDDGGNDGTPKPHNKNWVGLYGSADFALVSGDDVCGSGQDEGYACFVKAGPYEGDQYRGDPIASGNGNGIAGGFRPATIRAMLGYDRALSNHIALGLRAGWAFNGGPQPNGANAFLPIHLEARASVWFGRDVMRKVGIRPFAFIGGGMAQVDSAVDVSVREKQQCPPDGCTVLDPQGNVVQGNPQTQKLEVWRKSGQSFVGLGGGIMYALHRAHGIVAEVKVSQMFPTSGTVVSPSLGYVVGF